MDAKFDIFAGGLREIPEGNPGGGSGGGIKYTAGEGIEISENNVISVKTPQYITNETDDLIAFEVEYGKHYTFTQPARMVELVEGDLTVDPHSEFTLRFTTAESTDIIGWIYFDLPSVKWVGGVPEIELGKSYIISIKDGLGVCCEVE